jgi:DNA-binding transcriptional ArsR family regulator
MAGWRDFGTLLALRLAPFSSASARYGGGKDERGTGTVMSVEQQGRSRPSSVARVRNAREALLDRTASSALQPVRDVLCEPTRTQIVRALSAGPLSVGDLASILDRSKSATSQHLRVLRDAGIVSNRRRGRAVIYTLCSGPVIDATVQVLNQAAVITASERRATPLDIGSGHPR